MPEISITTGIRAALRAWGMADTAFRVKGYIEQFVAGASMRNVLLSATIDVALNMGANKALGYLTKVAAPLISRAGKEVFHIAKRGGHHIIPKWLGGAPKQLLHKIGWLKHRKLEKIVRKRMKSKFGIQIGGRGGSYEDIEQHFIDNPGSQAGVLNELMDIYNEFDKKNSTSLLEGMTWSLKNDIIGMY